MGMALSVFPMYSPSCLHLVDSVNDGSAGPMMVR